MINKETLAKSAGRVVENPPVYVHGIFSLEYKETAIECELPSYVDVDNGFHIVCNAFEHGTDPYFLVGHMELFLVDESNFYHVNVRYVFINHPYAFKLDDDYYCGIVAPNSTLDLSTTNHAAVKKAIAAYVNS